MSHDEDSVVSMDAPAKWFRDQAPRSEEPIGGIAGGPLRKAQLPVSVPELLRIGG
jgi:hypothetical protein